MKYILLMLLMVTFHFHAFAKSFGIVADGGDWNRSAEKTRDSMIRSRVLNLVMPGDNIYDTKLSYDSIWKNWAKKGFSFDIVAIGNHNKSHAEEVTYFNMQAEFYTKVIGAARFIVLNSNNKNTTQEQAQFLRTTLEDAKESFIFVVFHHPPFTLLHTWQERTAFHQATRPILLNFREKITALLLGHDHVASYNEMDSLPSILSGAVMNTYNVPKADYIDEGRVIKTKWSSIKGQIYWARLNVDQPTGQTWVHFVRSMNDEVSCSIRLTPRPVTLMDNCK